MAQAIGGKLLLAFYCMYSLVFGHLWFLILVIKTKANDPRQRRDCDFWLQDSFLWFPISVVFGLLCISSFLCLKFVNPKEEDETPTNRTEEPRNMTEGGDDTVGAMEVSSRAAIISALITCVVLWIAVLIGWEMINDHWLYMLKHYDRRNIVDLFQAMVRVSVYSLMFTISCILAIASSNSLYKHVFKSVSQKNPDVLDLKTPLISDQPSPEP